MGDSLPRWSKRTTAGMALARRCYISCVRDVQSLEFTRTGTKKNLFLYFIIFFIREIV